MFWATGVNFVFGITYGKYPDMMCLYYDSIKPVILQYNNRLSSIMMIDKQLKTSTKHWKIVIKIKIVMI